MSNEEWVIRNQDITLVSHMEYFDNPLRSDTSAYVAFSHMLTGIMYWNRTSSAENSLARVNELLWILTLDDILKAELFENKHCPCMAVEEGE